MQPADTLLAPELEQARKRRRNWLVLACVVLVIVAVGAVQYRTVVGWVQGIRSRRMAAKAESELLAGNIEQAVSKARDAYTMKPDEPSSIRIAAKIQILGGQPAAALPLYKQLLATGAMKPDDRRGYAESLLVTGAVAEAGFEIQTLLRVSPDDGPFLRLAARWAAVDGEMKKSLEFGAKAVEVEPENLEARLLLAVLQLAAGSEELRQEAIQSLLKLGGEKQKEGIEALKRLAVMPGLGEDVAGRVIVLLREHPLASTEQKLQALSMELALHPDERTRILDGAMKEYQNADPVVRRTFGVWLNSQAEYERMLKAIPIDEAFKRKDLLLVCLDSLAAMKRWDEVERILAMKNVPLDTAYKELFLARSALELGSATVEDLHWKQARLAAAPSVEQMLFIGNYAEKLRRFDQAEAAFNSLSVNASTARVAFEALLRIAQKRGNPAKVREILGKMSQRWPKDASVKNDCAYLNLLAGAEVDQSLAAARELVEASPASLAHRTTLALAALRKNDPAAALAVYRGLNIPWERVGVSQRAVYAAVLGANGKTDEAKAAADVLRLELLRPEERELIKPWRTP